MTWCKTIAALALGVVATTTQAETPEELTLVVNRGEDSATYYISMPASGIDPVLATDPAMLFSDDGRVPIDEFRVAGSFDLADEIFANITGSLEGDGFAFEAMSMMVHPRSTPLPFAAPWDAYTAISVCSVNYSPDELVPGVLQMYYGGFTDQVSGDATMNLHFPETGRDAMQIVVHRYEDGNLMGTDVRTLEDGGTLVIQTGGIPAIGPLVKSGGLWLLLLTAFVAAIYAFVHKARGEKDTAVPGQS